MSFVSLQQTSSESAKSAYTFIFGHITLQRFLPKSFSGEFFFDNIFEDFLMVEVGGWWCRRISGAGVSTREIMMGEGNKQPLLCSLPL